MNIKIKKLYGNVTLPNKAHDTDACFDIYAYIPEGNVVISPNTSVTIDTGFQTEIPKGYFAAVFPRSGMGIKRHLRLSNSTGIIDADYRGEWKVSLFNESDSFQVINDGDRIAQFTILPVLETTLQEVNDLDATDRGEGGFGSSGN